MKKNYREGSNVISGLVRNCKEVSDWNILQLSSSHCTFCLLTGRRTTHPRGALQTDATRVCLQLAGLAGLPDLLNVGAVGGAVALPQAGGGVAEGGQTVQTLQHAGRENIDELTLSQSSLLFLTLCRIILLPKNKGNIVTELQKLWYWVSSRMDSALWPKSED